MTHCRGFRRDIIHHSVDSSDLVGDPRRDLPQNLRWEQIPMTPDQSVRIKPALARRRFLPVSRHEVLRLDCTQCDDLSRVDKISGCKKETRVAIAHMSILRGCENIPVRRSEHRPSLQRPSLVGELRKLEKSRYRDQQLGFPRYRCYPHVGVS